MDSTTRCKQGCLNCGTFISPGFSTCSSVCLRELMDRGIKPHATQDRNVDGLVTMFQIASVFNVGYHDVIKWRASGRIIAKKVIGRTYWFDIEEVKKAMSNISQSQSDEEVAIAEATIGVDHAMPGADKTVISVFESGSAQEEPKRTHRRVGQTCRGIMAEMMSEAANEFAGSGDFENAYLTLRDCIVLDQKMEDLFR